jgi:hypothetical protein
LDCLEQCCLEGALVDAMRIARFANGVEQADRAADAEHAVPDERANRRRPAPHDLVNRQVWVKDRPLHPVRS